MFDVVRRNLRLAIMVPALAAAVFAAAHGLAVHHAVAIACDESTICPN